MVAVGIWLPFSPLSGVLGFSTRCRVPFFLALIGMVRGYLVLVELAKVWFFSRAAQQPVPPRAAPVRRGGRSHHIARGAGRTLQRPRGKAPARQPRPGLGPPT